MARRVALVGTELEENLSLRYLAASVEQDGFRPELIPFNKASDAERVLARVAALDPLVVGISMPFQTRARELVALAGGLRARGVRAHVTLGGHFATFEYPNLLRDFPAVDSVVRHEGERTLRDICRQVRDGEPVAGIPGTITRSENGLVDGGRRPLPPLDDLPFPDRRGTPREILGIASAPLVGSRGCYADCSFCCIHAYHRNADGPRYRTRSPENIVAEMQEEYECRGVRLFVFHDDNFLVPSLTRNLDRCRRLKELLHEAGLDDIALVIKCRPTDVHPELFALLRSMGLIRAYVGIETNSDEGIVSLNRRVTPAHNRHALTILRDLGIYCSFNVLLFDPEATLDGVRANLAFMKRFADVPFNFCRAEVYAGTPLKRMLEEQGRLRGDYWAWGYEMRDPRVEVLFRIATTAFAVRNFKSDGVANLTLGIRFDNEVLRRFHPQAWDPAWHESLTDLTRRVGLSSVRGLERALEFVSAVPVRDGDAVKRFTVDLCRDVARADLQFVTECKAFRREMERGVGSLTHSSVLGDDTSPALASSVGMGVSTEILPVPNQI
jgi:radical SAM superfamily enzyme YgiQ (UPF0313 family)